MTDTPEHKHPRELKHILAKLFRVQQDPDFAQEQAAASKAQASLVRAERLGHLRAERVPIRSAAEVAIVLGTGLAATKSLRVVSRWLLRTDVAPVLVLSGRPGCGKTVAGAWALAQRGGRYRTASQLARIFAATYGPLLEEQESLTRAPLLIVDDIGGEHDGERLGAALLELIDARQHSATRYRTVLTTNLSRDQLAHRYPSERLASRLNDPGIVVWVSDAGPDLRKGGRSDGPGSGDESA
jgi:hypothetical protein